MSKLLAEATRNFATLRAFARTRWFNRFPDREALTRFQARAITDHLADITGTIPFYASYQSKDLSCFPVMSKQSILENFHLLNQFQIPLAEAQSLALQGENTRNFTKTLPNGVSAGLSSGTSGQRGTFLVSPDEQYRWAGTILAKALSSPMVSRLINPVAPPLRVMLLLRANSNLYSATTSRRLKFHYGDLTLPLDDLFGKLNEVNPDVLVAPPSVLRHLAGHAIDGRVRISPEQVISAAEVLEPDDRTAIMSAWGVRADELYQCTEGFLGCTCEAGRIHLNEDLVHFEPDWLDDEKTRFIPVITDFTRKTQAFVRYRLDDILAIDRSTCPCGRVTQVVKSIEGRQDDVLWLRGVIDKKLNPIFPDLVRRTFMLAIGDIGDYRVRQSGKEWRVALESKYSPPDLLVLLNQHISRLALDAGCQPPEISLAPWGETSLLEKRRRIQCFSKPGTEAVTP